VQSRSEAGAPSSVASASTAPARGAAEPPRTAPAAQPGGPPEISVVLPIYNERDNLAAAVDEIEEALRPLDKPFEIVAVRHARAAP
jgi:hypothetical protein